MASREMDQVLALAGILQALEQVRAIAAHGHADPRRMEPCLRGLLGTMDGGVADLYGGREALYPGLRLLVEQLSAPREAQLTRYLVTVLHLERRLSSDRRRFPRVVSGLRTAAEQASYFGSVRHDNVLHNLGDLYSETVSTLRPRIMVQGERAHLEDGRNAAAIRALLLSALRAAALWRQTGGSRWRLVCSRHRLIERAREALATT
ncbi:High frequency lysogenization protein HflD [wastewater metagenome]|uniref:High frequency lysogenization protein HflD n=2 Tax=unclassified sequences TaxID=12908 RepID=A0A5B8RBK3_9ZZZZ|nr:MULTISPECIES: high frequency lysogenization protein HflD [Arhodomonas]MCS4503206.1 high frequency lysogenization protein HflD [Arhodomonas aquaeolei]QEA04742.1 high frequency lysogenization protein HflD [uncultured organism]